MTTPAPTRRLPLIVELVGLAAAGKTTLSGALSHRDQTIRVAADLAFGNREHFPIFVGHVPFLFSLILRRGRSGRSFTWNETKAMLYLTVWSRVLRQELMSGAATALLLDHGPIFKLATLNAFGPDRLKDPGFEDWWHRVFQQWASTLDLVIWLTAPPVLLLERINARSQRHVVKGQRELDAYEFLTRYQTSYEQIWTRLTAYGRPTLLRFDTSQTPVEHIVDEVRAAFRLKLGSSDRTAVGLS